MRIDTTRRERFLGARRDRNLCVLEGLHAVKHAHRFGAVFGEVVTRDPEAQIELAHNLAPDIADWLAAAAVCVGPDGFDQLAPLAHPTGVMAVAERRAHEAEQILRATGGPVVFLEEPVHLGNVGAAIRVVAAAGGGALLTSGRHDPWSPESLRAAAGLHFAVPVARVEALGAYGDRFVALDADAPDLREVALPERPILAFGSERQGLSSEIMDRAAVRASLPMREGVSSLNLATAVAAVLYTLRATSER